MLHLLTSPGVYRKLKDEIAEAIKAGIISSPMTEAEAKNLPYLHVRIFFLPTLTTCTCTRLARTFLPPTFLLTSIPTLPTYLVFTVPELDTTGTPCHKHEILMGKG